MVKQITTIDELDEEVNNCSQFCILYFTAQWCGPCKMISPFIDKLDENTEVFKHIKFLKIDVDESDELCEKFEIESMPTFIFLDKEQTILDKMVGCDKNLLTEKIKNLFTQNVDVNSQNVSF